MLRKSSLLKPTQKVAFYMDALGFGSKSVSVLPKSYFLLHLC